MRNIKGTNCLLMVSLLMVSTAASAIPWPVAISHCAGPDYNNNYTLMKTYGTMNKDWDDVGPGVFTNFHSGIDIAAVEIGNDSVFCVEDGELTYKWPESPGEDEYRVVICPLSSDEGWYYKHLRGKSGDHGWVESALIGSLYYEGYVIAEMYNGVAPTPHLHFEKSLREPSSGSPGLDNPLDFLEPAASAAENFIWSVYSPEQLKQTFFLPNYLAFNDPGDLDWENIWQ